MNQNKEVRINEAGSRRLLLSFFGELQLKKQYMEVD
jgi:hypothetical protein